MIQAEELREKLIEKVAELDEELTMEKYLEGEEITVDEIKAAIRKGTVNVEILPSYLWFFITETKVFN